jgi:hypothetical protein
MLTAPQLRTKLAEYVLGEIPLPEFEDSIVSESWNVQRVADRELQALVFEIEAKLAEHSGGHIDEDCLREALAPFAKRYVAEVLIGEEHPGVRIHGSSSQSFIAQTEFQFVSVDIRPAVAFSS